jgi:hypothetical protein
MNRSFDRVTQIFYRTWDITGRSASGISDTIALTDPSLDEFQSAWNFESFVASGTIPAFSCCLKGAADFSAGAGDKLTLGLTTWINKQTGAASVISTDSMSYSPANSVAASIPQTAPTF